MDNTVVMIVEGLISVLAGFGLAVIILRKQGDGKVATMLAEAEKEGEQIKKDKILQAKEKFLELKTEHEGVIHERNQRMEAKEKKFKEKDDKLRTRIDENSRNYKELKDKQSKLDKRFDVLERRSKEVEQMHRKQVEQLEVISGLSAEEAKKQLVDALKDEAKAQALALVQEQVEEAKLTANKEAKKIILQTIQRVGVEHSIENSVSVFNIESDDVKGRIIGREGRNIRALEAATGVEIIVDDTPEAIILSCFDPVRREVARLSLHNLVTDGRIHPARIEEVVKKTIKELEEEIAETGKRTAIDLGIHNLHPELVRMVGRMKYRSSYGQNLLQHSREVANLCSIMASELGLNPKAAKRAGLLHDIGKVPDEESELPHAILGMKLCEKYGEKPDVCNAVGAHHDEVEMNTLIAPIIQVCDGISGARPGARRQIVDSYIKRLKELEELALQYPGVSKSYAIQAGRELRVVVDCDKVDDNSATQLSYDISQKIQSEMTYPGQVKVTVIRETRAVNYAR